MNKLILTADQIYAMAYIIDAKYLDYYYISLAKRSKDNKLWLNECTKQMVSSEILVEDFSGDLSIDSRTEELLKPIYFGEKESSLDINILGDNEDHVGLRFHFFDGRTVMTKMVEEGIEISEVTTDDIKNIVNGLLSSNWSVKDEQTVAELDVNTITKVYVVKNVELNVKSLNVVFLESNGMIYEQDIDNNTYSVSGSEFSNRIIKVLTEV